ncbi:Thiamine transporter ThiT [bioreactor metagenome]|uniref:Thiamine transporter ThiT n=1 Tax=bioreactor metagenome TaxID=1076179 RepID=A0A645BUM7_9ZZZZ
MNKKIQKLTVSGVMIALAVSLSFVKVFALPYGGSITAFSMVPIMLVGFIYGIPWGLLTGAVYGVIEGVLGATVTAAFADQDVKGVLIICLLDYIVAFSVLGLSSIFKKGIKNAPVAFGLGTLTSGLLRYLCHFISGYLVFGQWAEWFFTQKSVTFGQKILEKYSGKGLAAIYSLIYNGTYMIPEIILSVILAVILMNIPQVKRIAYSGNLNK